MKQQFSIERIARLARLKLEPSEAKKIQTQLSEFLDFANTLNSMPLEDTSPFFGQSEMEDPAREDDVQTGLSQSEALKNAPESDQQFFLVPPVFE